MPGWTRVICNSRRPGHALDGLHRSGRRGGRWGQPSLCCSRPNLRHLVDEIPWKSRLRLHGSQRAPGPKERCRLRLRSPRRPKARKARAAAVPLPPSLIRQGLRRRICSCRSRRSQATSSLAVLALMSYSVLQKCSTSGSVWIQTTRHSSTQPCSQVASISEALRICYRRDQRAGRDWSDAWHILEFATELALHVPDLGTPLKFADLTALASCPARCSSVLFSRGWRGGKAPGN